MNFQSKMPLLIPTTHEMPLITIQITSKCMEKKEVDV
jgi:hypothetical protein